MRKYNNFIKEENLIDFLKKGFVNTLTLLSKEKQSTMSNLMTSITKSTTLIDSINLVKTTLGDFIVNKIDNIDQLKTISNDDIIAYDMILKTLSKKFNKDKLLPSTFLSDINDNQLKKTLSYETEKKFLIQLPFNINLLLSNILSNAGVDKEIIDKKLNNNQQTNEAQDVQYINNVDKLDDNLDNLNPGDENNGTEEKKEEKPEIDFDKVTTLYKNHQQNIFNILIKNLKKFNIDEQKELKDPKNF